jgi:uncharacterized protein (UPF0548 family)
MSKFTYAEVGATRYEPLPAHYNHLRHRVLVGAGDEVFERAGQAVLRFDMHRAAGAKVRTDSPEAEAGLHVEVTLGPFTVPNEVVYVVDEPHRMGFAYGTLPGHQERGEESFLVEQGPDGRIWLTIKAFSIPARWATVLAGPLAVLVQRVFARLCGRALIRLASASRTVDS